MTAEHQPIPTEQAKWLMADLLLWHQREAKPEYWRFYDRRDHYTTEDFVADHECIGDLTLVGEIGTHKRSKIWRYQYDPDQEHQVKPDTSYYNPATDSSISVFDVNHEHGTVDVTRDKKDPAPAVSALMPNGPIKTRILNESLQRIAEALLIHGTDQPGPYLTSRRLLGRHTPTFTTGPTTGPLRHPGEPLLDCTIRLVSTLNHSTLAIQGPPGTGKTYTSARAILHLIKQGQKIGVSAFSHSAIRTLLTEIITAAEESGQPVSILQKAKDTQAVHHPTVTVTDSNDDMATGSTSFDIVAGTAWLFARPEMAETVDTLFIDEAGQLSLANVLAASPATKNLVLVGDPQQLSQPSQTTHPDSAGNSAMEHILNGQQTIDEDIGILLDETRRMHPDICNFISEQFYNSRLTAHPTCKQQHVTQPHLATSHGLYFLPVEHEHNRTSSTEEAQAISHLYNQLLTGTWVDDKGTTKPLTTHDIIVVTPYNSQVTELARHLPENARIGTVDKIQGQGAAVVLMSLAASSSEDIPRGLDFLLEPNRLNVSISRAKAITILAANPRLAATPAKTITQMKLVNTLCRYIEYATHLTLATTTT